MSRDALTVDEAPWMLQANDRLVATGTFTPHAATSLGVGRLLAEGYIRERDDLLAVDAVLLDPGITLIRATVAPAPALLAESERRHRADRGCGLLHFVTCDRDALRRSRSLPLPPDDRFPGLFRSLYRESDARHPAGGMHAAALSDGQCLFNQCEDVGRHNAVDRAIGSALLAGMDLRCFGLILSARVSGQIALAAARSGISWIASRSVPTTLAVAIADAARLTILGRAAGPGATRFDAFEGGA
ncbi:MAG: formate dehydrogenase accessory sulfurtransferase FdhD [Longimicrobiales bacterium]